MKFLKPLTVFIHSGFKDEHAAMSAFNLAISYNFKNALTCTFPDYEIDYSKALLSHGNLPGAINPAASLISAVEIKFTWEDNRNAMADDRVLLVVYNPAKQQVSTIEGGNTRMERSQTISVPSTFIGDKIQWYTAFQNAKLSEVSNSQCVGSLTVK